MAKESLRDRARRRAEEKEQTRKSAGGYLKLPDKVEFVETKKGKQDLDILVYTVQVSNHPAAEKGEQWYERTYFVHRGIGVDNRTYVCPLKTFKRPCPICEYRAALIKEGYDKNKDAIGDLKPRERQLFNVDMGDKGIQVLDMSYFTFGGPLEKEIREGEDDWAGFADLKEGYTLRIRWDEKKLGDNTFVEAGRIDFVERDPYKDSVLDEVVDLDACIVALDYDALNKIFLEIENEDNKGGKSGEKEEAPKTEGRRERGSNPERERRREPAPESEEAETEKKEDPPPTRTRRQREPEKEQEREQEKAPDPAPAPETRTRRQREPEKEPESKKDEGGDESCPGKGTYAVDCDKLDYCFDCTKWEDCREDADKLVATSRRKR